MKIKAIILVLVIAIIAGGVIVYTKINKKVTKNFEADIVEQAPTPTILPSTTATPTPKPVTVEDMNKKYGPCVQAPVLMYHHIQTEDEAKPKNQTGLTVTPDWLKKQMEYLKQKGYNVASMKDLVAFFNDKKALPKKSVLITLDDAYRDNYTHAWPIFKELNIPATIFTPTGLVGVADYLTWDQIGEMNGLVEFANHTWSHHSALTSEAVMQQEVGWADKQLTEHGLDNPKVFAYPYGKPSFNAEEVLKKDGYQLAFTTVHGKILCQTQRYELPRIRVGNAPLSKYGL